MDVLIASGTGSAAPGAAATAVAPVVPPRRQEAVAASARPAQHAAAPVTDPVDGSRLSAVVDLISSLTGREVKLVPPTAYLVSAPATAPQVEVLAPVGLASELSVGDGPVVIGIESVLRTGTSMRMLLDRAAGGGLELRSSVDVAL